MNGIVEKQKIEFEKNLPMERGKFIDLFDYLDEKLSESDCDDTNKITKEYLEKTGQNNIDNLLKWLTENNGNCDCEILANVEELFE
jgi:hypothetical protein